MCVCACVRLCVCVRARMRACAGVHVRVHVRGTVHTPRGAGLLAPWLVLAPRCVSAAL